MAMTLCNAIVPTVQTALLMTYQGLFVIVEFMVNYFMGLHSSIYLFCKALSDFSCLLIIQISFNV